MIEKIHNGPMVVGIRFPTQQEAVAGIQTFNHLYDGREVVTKAECDLMDGANGSNPTANHAVQLVGYQPATADEVAHWIFKNSYGESWGDGGFGKVEAGVGACNIDTFASGTNGVRAPSLTVWGESDYWLHFPQTCVNDRTESFFEADDLEHCQDECTRNSRWCVGILWGVDHGGSGKKYETGDCVLLRHDDDDCEPHACECDGADMNTDMYTPADASGHYTQVSPLHSGDDRTVLYERFVPSALRLYYRPHKPGGPTTEEILPGWVLESGKPSADDEEDVFNFGLGLPDRPWDAQWDNVVGQMGVCVRLVSGDVFPEACGEEQVM